MTDFSDILQLSVGVSILVVWLVRSHVRTNFRVGEAATLREEVSEVGLPDWFYDIIKIIKPFFAFFLLIGLVYRPFTLPCMVFTTIFMIGAIWMHLKAKDNLYKIIPAFTLLVFCIIILFINLVGIRTQNMT
jgi:hypothetical protein